MSFYLPSDPGFAEALSARRGESTLDPVFDEFVTAFVRTFGTAPLTLTTDTIRMPRRRGATPRLGVVLERSAQARAFRADGGSYDPEQQLRVARLFAATVPHEHLAERFGIAPEQPRIDWATDLFVIVNEFERTAKWAAHDEVRGPELDAFVASLELGAWFWCTRRFAGPPIVFVHTDEQASALRQRGTHERWADLYYPLVRRHDEFGYLTREEIQIQVDSRQRFEREYAGSWHHYFR